MPQHWARRQTIHLFKVEDGKSWIEWDLEWGVEKSLQHKAFFIPASSAYGNAIALAITGHQPEARLFLQRTAEIVEAALLHDQPEVYDWDAALEQKDYNYLLFGCRWLLHGEYRSDLLSACVEHLANAERLSEQEGLELGEDGYEEMALCSVLTHNGGAALDFLRRGYGRGAVPELDAALKGAPSRIKTLALAAHCLESPPVLDRAAVQKGLADGLKAYLKEQSEMPVPQDQFLLLWLDLPNLLSGRQGDPWAMLRSLDR